MQKLEEELDVVLFDRSGHRTKFTNVGRMLLDRGRVLLEAADKLTTDAEALARGWETHITIVSEALSPAWKLFPLVDRLALKANTKMSIFTEVLAGAWERLEQGRADIVIAPDMHFRASSEINSRKLYKVTSVYVASPDHPIHLEPEPLSELTRVKYRGVAVADTALTRRSAGIPDHPNLKTALGISSRSLVHRWTQAGAPGQIPGYATHIQQLAKASTVIKRGGWVGTAIGGGASYMKVKNVCSAGNQEACEKIKFTETGSFVGSVGGGAIVGLALSGSAVTTLCVALGVPTAGVASLACAVVAVGAASVAAGVVGGATGEQVGEKIYEAVK